MTFVRTEYPQFSWSHSRARMLDECERRYYWHYYGSHNGWEQPEGHPARTAWRLKKLTTYQIAFGQVVHQCARDCAEALRSGRELPDLGLLRERVRGSLNRLVITSRNRGAFLARPSATPMTTDGYYGRVTPPLVFEKLRQKLGAVLCNLVESAIWAEIRGEHGSEVRVVDDLATFECNDVLVYVAPDLVFRTSRSGWVIVDWKTGSAETAGDQLALYGLYARDTLRLPMLNGAYECRVVHLDTGVTEVVAVGDEEMADAEARIDASVDRMCGLLSDSERNIARGSEAFALASDSRACRYCNFQELCYEELTSLGRAPRRIS